MGEKHPGWTASRLELHRRMLREPLLQKLYALPVLRNMDVARAFADNRRARLRHKKAKRVLYHGHPLWWRRWARSHWRMLPLSGSMRWLTLNAAARADTGSHALLTVGAKRHRRDAATSGRRMITDLDAEAGARGISQFMATGYSRPVASGARSSRNTKGTPHA